MSWVVTGVSAAPGLLDAYSGAAAAYSLRRLTWAYGGPVVRVRRSSDNTEQDFTAAQVTDGTLTTFCGAGNGFVRTWYDQSENGRHAQQATTANQPQIVSSGTLITDSSKPVIEFNPSAQASNNQLLQTSNFGLIQPVHLFMAFRFTAFIGGATPENVLDGAVISDSLDVRVNGSNFQLYAGSFLYNNTIGRSTSHGLYNVIFNGASSVYRYNASQVATGSAGTTSTGGLTIGNYAAAARGAASRIRELIVYSSSQSGVQNGIESNINTHYAIY